MLAFRWIKLLTCFVIFRVKQQLMLHFIQNLSLDFHSFLDLYLHGKAHQLTTIGGIAWAQAIGSKFCSFHFAHINLNSIQKLYDAWIVNSRSSQTFNLVYTDISYVFIWKMWFSYLALPQSYGSLSDNFFVIHASLYYGYLLVLALLVNFAFYQQ